MITLTPLCGPSVSADPSTSLSTTPISYLLTIDEVHILLDLGSHDPSPYPSSPSSTIPATTSTSSSSSTKHPSLTDRDYTYESTIRELAPKISLLLLSHSPASYLGLYPYARTHWGLRCPVYATQPTVEMGRVVCLEESMDWRAEVPLEEGPDAEKVGDEEGEGAMAIDVYADPQPAGKGKEVEKPLKGPFICTPEEINEAFNWVKSVRYNQPVHMAGMLSHLLLTPYASGHTLGGTLFKLRSPTSGSIVYAIGMNHTTERHLDSTVLLSAASGAPGAGGAARGTGAGAVEGLMRPDVLIAEGGRSLIVGAKQKDRAKALLELVTSTLQSSRSLLFPVDASPRLLELLILLDQHWSYQTSQDQRWTYPLCLVSRTAGEMMTFARSLLEWMGGSVAREEEDGQKGGGRKRQREGKGPLMFRHIKFFPNADALMATYPKGLPMLVLSVPMSMNYGSSRLFFKSMADDAGNVIVLTGRSEQSSLAQELFDKWNAGQSSDAERFGHGKVGKPVALEGEQTVTIDSKVALSGKELEDHMEAEKQAKEKEAAQRAAAERSRRMLEADDLESDSDDSDASDAEMDLDPAAGAGGDSNLDAILNPNGRAGDAFAENEDVRATSFDIYVKGQQTRSVGFFRAGASGAQRFRMFPFVERKGRKVDTYGENLDIGAWLRKGREIEQEVEPEEVKEAKRRKKEEEEKKQEPPEPPSKYITEEFHIQLAARIFYVDMEGQHDGRAIKTIVPLLNPRRLIVINSAPAPTSDLLLSLRAFSTLTNEIYTPDVNEQISIGEQTKQWSVSLSEGLMGWVNGVGSASGKKGKGKWSKYEDYELAMVTGRLIHSTEASGVPTLDLPRQREAIEDAGDAPRPAPQAKPEAPAEGENEADLHADEADGDGADGEGQGADGDMPDLKPFYDLPAEGEQDLEVEQKPSMPTDLTGGKVKPLPKSLFIGDLRLTSLKATLAAQGIPAEFVGEGTLLCGSGLEDVLKAAEDEVEGELELEEGKSLVVVRKGADGGIVIEGAVEGGSEEEGRGVYNVVKDIIYGSFARVVV